MKYSIKALAATAMLVSANTVSAGVIDFIALTQTGGYGESAWSSLNLSSGGANVAISGHATNDNDSRQYAYLDWGNAGLGACKDVVTASKVDKKNAGSSSNNCAPSSDDNVTTSEYLRFIFDTNVVITKIWFNNNHDGGFDSTDKVNINGNLFSVNTGYANGINGIGSFNVAANTAFDVKYHNEEFYISAIEFSKVKVPEPSTILLFGLGLLGLVGARRVKQ
ncbi:MAG TPA: PEP-CTERM sorting domain-containing protein [Cellvibrio sp.]|nr:PEP-CTERM sorting domain-containing protein [Cellvibrio sp.]